IVAPVIAVGEVKAIDVPLIRRIALADEPIGQFVGGTDLGAATLAGMVERVLVHLLSGSVVDDVNGFNPLIVGLNPGVDPKRFDAHDLLLFIRHGARDIHHVDDDGNALRFADLFPTPILLIFANGHDDRMGRVIDLRGNLAPQRALEGPLEVPQRLRTGLTDTRVSILGSEDVLFAAGLDAWQGQLFAEDGGQLLQSQLDFKDVRAGFAARPLVALALRRTERLAHLSLSLAGAGGSFATVAELRNLDLRKRDADEVLPLLSDHLPAADIL